MKRLSITHTGGDNLVFDVPDLGDFPSAVARQDASWPLTLDDGSTLYMNTRHVVAWTAEDVSQSDSEEPEDTRTVAELKEALDKAGVEYDGKALKAELLELAKTNEV